MAEPTVWPSVPVLKPLLMQPAPLPPMILLLLGKKGTHSKPFHTHPFSL